jgi:hypothetical protein
MPRTAGLCRAAIRSDRMPTTVITLHVHKPGQETDTLLAALAERLHKGRIEPIGPSGLVHIILDLPAGEAWDLVVGQLDEISPDWGDYLLIAKRAD